MDVAHPPMSSADVAIKSGHPSGTVPSVHAGGRQVQRKVDRMVGQKLAHWTQLHGSWLYDLREVVTSLSLSFFICVNLGFLHILESKHHNN